MLVLGLGLASHLAKGVPKLLRLLPPLARLGAPGAPDGGVIKSSRLGFPSAAVPSRPSSATPSPLALGEFL